MERDDDALRWLFIALYCGNLDNLRRLGYAVRGRPLLLLEHRPSYALTLCGTARLLPAIPCGVRLLHL